MRILMSIPSLEPGGAERQFAALACGLAQRGHEVLAVALGQGGPLAAELGQARLITLGKHSRLDNLRVLLALAGILRREAPQVHYSFLPTCCVLGSLLRPFYPQTRLVMGIRAADASGQGRAGRLLLGLEARLSRQADLVIANSEAGRRLCLERGFPAGLLRVVDNGTDTARFHPDRSLGAVLRSEWGVGKDEQLIGLVARLDPLKDHPTFLAAAALLAARSPSVRFVCVGGGPASYAQSLRERAAALGLGSRLIWAGERTDMPGVYNALDILCLSSSNEGFPNVLGEAMSCGVPCVATDAGDAGRVLGGTGLVVAPGHAAALAAGMETLLARLTQEGARLGALCRGRVEAEFSLPRLMAATEDILAGEIVKGL
ncbi:MAG: glycosyltransferase [Humidesulfovibrio sp.]|uniref:glycosyltransferase n=1 Tax=Humidesulfovibrio sp. TaxID=2910988 RepID=UPI002734BB2E|nr:glycosyltransferase [Humidesulfovibrio sp.]MDP2848390.1 glycosyltransferase [Humidesulfovibrio sp.]